MPRRERGMRNVRRLSRRRRTAGILPRSGRIPVLHELRLVLALNFPRKNDRPRPALPWQGGEGTILRGHKPFPAIVRIRSYDLRGGHAPATDSECGTPAPDAPAEPGTA